MSIDRIPPFIFSLLLVIAVGLMAGDTFGQSRDTTEINGKKYILHEIVKGNTLYSLSREYEVSVDMIVEENPGVTSGLSIGQKVRIPVQNMKDEQKRRMALDGNYIVHEVIPRQTLYSISKMYNVEISDIVAENQSVIYGLKNGDLLRIPLDKIKKEKSQLVDITRDEYPDHEVLPGETLFSLSRRYNVSVDDIKRLNNGLPDGLKEGQVINIPLPAEGRKVYSNMDPDSLKLKDRYHIALFLPLYIDLNDSLQMDNNTPEDDDRLYGNKNTIAALKFYQGVKMALDSMGKQGFKATLHVYDTENDLVRVNNILKKPEIEKMDLFIGPLYPEIFEAVSKFAREKGIAIVSPVNPSNRQLLGNPYLIKVITSKTTQVTELAKYVAVNYRKQHVLVLKKDFELNTQADSFIEQYKESITLMNDTQVLIPVAAYTCNSATKIDEFKGMLMKDTQNIVFVPSTDRVYVTDVVRRLYSLSREYDITVIGLDDWLKYDNIDLEYFNQLKLHIIGWNYIDYDKPQTLKFVQAYYNRYKSFPGEYANRSFDLSYYLFSLMKSYGSNFLYYIERNPGNMSSHNFRFCQTGIESGYENQSLVILKMEDLKLVKVN